MKSSLRSSPIRPMKRDVALFNTRQNKHGLNEDTVIRLQLIPDV